MNYTSAPLALLDLLISALELLVALIALWVASKQLKNAAKSFEKSTNWNRIDATYKYIYSYGELLDKLELKTIDTLGLQTFEVKEISQKQYKKLCTNPRFRKDVYEIIKYYETLGQGVESEYYDLITVANLYGPQILSVYSTLVNYILMREEETGFLMCNHFKRLVGRIKDLKNQRNG